MGIVSIFAIGVPIPNFRNPLLLPYNPPSRSLDYSSNGACVENSPKTPPCRVCENCFTLASYAFALLFLRCLSGALCKGAV